MAENIFSMQFDSSGCTNRLVRNLGGVTFSTYSDLGAKRLRAAYFEPYNSDAVFEVHSSSVKSIMESKKDWSMYFLFRTNQLSNSILPIISYIDENGGNLKLLYMSKGRLLICPNRFTTYYTPKLEYVVDDKYHTFYMSWDLEHTLRVYIDGNLMMEKLEADPFTIADTFYIGWSQEAHLDGWYLDDFNIFSGLLFRGEFVPPTNYVVSLNTISNYYGNNDQIRSNMEDETIQSIEKNREHTLYTIRTRQRGVLPKRVKFNWHEETHGYFRNHSWERIRKTDVGTFINVDGVDQPFLSNVVEYFESNMNIALDENKILPMMIFVNGVFRRLSKMDIIKSDDYYCFRIYDRERSESDPVTSFEIITLPFPVVYEEDYGERDDLIPLYAFNLDGKFDPAHGHTFYYIDDSKDNHTKQIGIREDFEDPTNENENINLLNSVWRYGTLEMYRLSDDGKGAFMRFQSDDYSWIDPTSKIILYNGVSYVHPRFYKVIGYDLIYFPNLGECGIRAGRTVSIQIITDSTDAREEMLFEDVTDTKTVSVQAIVQDQSTFTIPEVGDDDKWRRFLVFRGPILLDLENDYSIDYDNNTLTILDRDNYLGKGQSLTFIFIKVRRAGAGGNFLLDPIFLYLRPKEDDSYKAHIPPIKGIKVTASNSVLFRNGTMVNPDRYTIVGDTIQFGPDEPPMNFLDGHTVLILVVLKMIQSDRDPRSWRVSLIKNEWTKGNRFVLYDLAISKHIKLTLDNLVCFDQNGRLITDLRGKIYNMNIVKRLMTKEPLERQVRYLTCVYRDDYLSNGSHVTKFPLNDAFLKEYLMAKREYYELDGKFDQFLADFNFRHSSDIGYGENLRNSINSILQYDPNKFDDVYDKRATAERISYDVNKLNLHMTPTTSGSYQFNIPPREVYSSPAYSTKHLFFSDGELAEWNNDITYTATDDMVVTVPDHFVANSKLEAIAFKGMCSDVISLSAIPTSVKKATLSIPAILTTGKEYNFNLSSTVTIKENISLDFPATLRIPLGFDYVEARNEYGTDLFTATISVGNDFEYYLPCSLDVFRFPDGIVIDLDHFNMILEFNSTLVVE